MADTKRILILVGGYGGVWAGKILEKRYASGTTSRLLSSIKGPSTRLMTELHEVAGWRAEPESVQVSFRKIFGAQRIGMRRRFDRESRLRGEGRPFRVERVPFRLHPDRHRSPARVFRDPGVKENCFTLWSFDDAMRIRQHLETIFEKAVEETDAAERRRLLTFVVAGAGFTGIELAGEILEYRDSMCRKHFIDPAETRVIVIEALPSILPILEEPLRERPKRTFEGRAASSWSALP